MWSHVPPLLLLLLLVVGALATDTDRINLPGSCSGQCMTKCAIVRIPDNSQLLSQKSCVIYKDPYDLNINIGKLSISAHLKVLAGSIPFFEDTSTSIEAKTKALLDQDLDPQAVKTLFRYAYTRKVKMNMDNAEQLLKASQFFGIANVISICTDFIISRMNTQNVIEIINNEDASRNETRIRKAAENYILNHFADVSLSSEFLHLHSAPFVRIMRSNEIRNTTEDRIFDAAHEWIQHNASERSALSFQVMTNVRFPLIDNNYLMQNVSRKVLKMRHDQVNHMLFEAMEYQFTPDGRPDLKGICRSWPRNGMNKLVSVKWGVGNSPVEMYEPGVQHIETAANAPNKAYYFVLRHDCNVYAIGGSGSNTVEVFNAMTNAWSSIAPMSQIRYEPAAAELNGIIVVTGGYNAGVVSSSESYDISKAVWKPLAGMAQARYGHRLVAIADCVYAIGGYGAGYLKSVEMYNISSDTWTLGPPMLNDRYQFGAALLHGKLYVGGGQGSGTQLAEVFDPAKQTWTALARMGKGKSQMSLVPYQYKLWAFGYQSLTSEVYDPETDSWSDVPDVLALDGNYREMVLLNY